MALMVLGQGTAVSSAFAVESASFKIGGINIAPTFDGEMRYIDNLLRTSESSVETWGLLLKPQIQTWVQKGFNTYSLTYSLANHTYFDSSDDDVTDHKVDLDIHQEFNARHTLNLSVKYYHLHEDRGTGIAEGEIGQIIDKPLEYDYQGVGAQYLFGNENSRGRFALQAKFNELEYQNFRVISAPRDRDTIDLRGTFYYRSGSRAEVVAEIGRVEQNYKFDSLDGNLFGGSLDSKENTALVGMDWAATGRTSGTLKIGGFQRSYRDSTRGEDQGFHWEAELTWKPRTYSSLHFNTRRLSRETNGEGDYVETALYRADWKHLWSDRARSSIYLGYTDENYIGSPRTDEMYRMGASIEYSMRRWIDIDIGYRYEERSSNARNLSYDRNVFFLGVKMSL
jgi:hypothetical protein